MISKIRHKTAMGMAGMVALIIGTTTVVAPLTSWLLSTHQTVNTANNQLELMTVAQEEWAKLSNMSIAEIKSNKSSLTTQYNVGDYKVKVNLGTEGFFPTVNAELFLRVGLQTVSVIQQSQ